MSVINIVRGKCLVVSSVIKSGLKMNISSYLTSRSQWPCGLRLRSTAVRLVGLWVRIPPGAWISVVGVECCTGRGLCDGLITGPEESYGCLSVVSVVCCQVEVCATG